MGVILANNVYSALAATLTETDTTMFLAAEPAGVFPELDGGTYFYATISSPGTPPVIEVVRVIERAGLLFTIERGADGTTARIFPAGAEVAMRVNAASVMEAFPTNNDFLRL